MPPVGSTDPIELTQEVLTVEFGESEWAKVAKPLALRLLAIDGVQDAKVGKDGKITISHDVKKDLSQKVLKKLVKKSGLIFKSLKAPEPEPVKEKEGNIEKEDSGKGDVPIVE